ncbi:MAG: hypothetical protein JST75_15615 [Bacteroidetes bacterium]|nr:hypothetical protein [Bacteroidota bacterium]
MKKIFQFSLLLIVLLSLRILTQAQIDSLKLPDSSRHRIAVFIPLYLDSAFDPSLNYRYDKNFPKFINPGLEFYEGLQLAADSLEKKDLQLDIQVYDTRSAKQTIAQTVQSPEFQSTQLILGYVNAAELRDLAASAMKKNIPFINVNFPNDGGITNNQYLIILNSMLKTHCESIYKFIQRNYPTYNIVFLKKKGAQEDRLKNYFTEIEKNTASVPLKSKYVVLDEPVSSTQLLSNLDSTRKNLVVVLSLDENFGKTICAQIAAVNKSYVTKIFGMPTWDAVDFARPEYTDQEIYYTTPFYTNPGDSLVVSIQQYFKNKFYSRPSDMVYRGYETLFRFGQLLGQYGHNLSGSIGEKKYKLFNDFDIQPVFLNKQNLTLDYFENKKLYFIKKVAGNVTAVY